jgi:SET domain-containing protein
MQEKLFVSSKIEVRRSSIHGYGVFAKEDISSGEILEECYYLDLGQFWSKVPTRLKDYVYAVTKASRGASSSSAVVLGNAMIYNHSEDYSVEYRCDTGAKTFTYWANKDIKADEELFTTYGENSYSATRIRMKNNQD